MPFDVAKSLLIGMTRKMALGSEVVDSLDKLVEPPAPEPPPPEPPKGPSPEILQLQAQLEMEKMKREQEAMERESQLATLEFQQKLQLMKAQGDLAMTKITAQAQAASQRAKERTSNANV